MIKKLTTWILWVSLSWTSALGQCALDTQIVLQEVDTARLLFEVENARNNDLSDPSQGLCKVRIFFEHEFLGDLRIFLISPSGQMVQLVGNEGNFGLTQFTEWNVCFVPSSQASVPDPGFAPVWSNNQIWGSFAGIYNGTYYPFMGSLEDFDSGPVNGVWTLLAYDRTIFYQGRIKSIELEFCDTDGLICNTCDPGQLTINMNQSDYCAEDTICLSTSTDFIPNDQDSLEYDFQNYIISPAGFVLDTGQDVKLIQYPPGTYSLCGLMYYEGDTALLPGPGSNWTRFVQNLNQSMVCAEPSECHQFTIHPNRDTFLHEIVLCKDDSIRVGNQVFRQSGQHYIDLQSQAGCDSIIDLQIEKIEFDISISVRDTLDCNTDSLWVYVDQFQVPPNSKIKWTSETNPLLDTLETDSLLISQAGRISLIVSASGCSDTAHIDILQDSMRPTVFLIGDTLSCNQTSVLISALTNANNPTFDWSGPGGMIPSDSSAIWVTSGGSYEVAITNDNGCITRSSIFIQSDTTRPVLNVQYDSLVCQEDSIPVQLISDVPITNVVWDGPAGRLNDFRRGFIFEEGWYRITARGENGCEAVDSVFLKKNLTPARVILASRPIECVRSGALLLRSDVDSITPFQWQGPQGLLSNDSIFESNVPGQYFLTYESRNGCAGIDSITLVDQRTYPNIRINVDFLACLGDSAWAVATSDSSLGSYTWVKPNGAEVNNDSVFLDRNGWYTIIVTNAEGCTSTDSVEINASNSPTINLFADTVNCFNDKQATLFATSDRANLIYNWFLDGRLVSADSVLMTDRQGSYILETRSPAGCFQSDTIQVIVDTLQPQIILTSPDTITCNQPIAQIQSFVNPMLAQYAWSGPGGFTSFMRNPQVSRSGRYRVTVTSTNGCSDTASIIVIADTLSPRYSLMSDSINCNRDSVTILSTDTNPRWSWTWTFPDSSTRTGYPVNTGQGGLHQSIVTDTINGCSDTFNLDVFADTNLIRLSLPDTLIPCDSSNIEFSIPTGISFDQVDWVGPFGFSDTGRTVVISREGIYSTSLLATNGCVSRDEFFIYKKDLRSQLDIEVQNITCLHDTACIITRSVEHEMTGFWITPNGGTIDSDTIKTRLSGTFLRITESVEGCRDTFRMDVLPDTTGPIINLNKSGDLICDRERVDLMADSDVMSDQSMIEWSTSNGGLITPTALPRLVNVEQAGTYQVCITNNLNSCQTCDSIVVLDTGQTNIRWTLDVMPPTCPGESDGSIQIINFEGGEAPYHVFFNDIRYEVDKIWDFLREGVYDLSLIDANGCRIDSTIVLETGQFLQVDAGSDTSVTAGSTFNLDGSITNLSGIDGSFEWRLDSLIFGRGELQPSIAPVQTTVYQLVFITDEGCEWIDEVIVYIKETPNVFVPNIFTPNDDGVNDQLIVGLGPGVKEVQLFEIYDRWGELVHRSENVLPSNNTISWDGRLDDRPLVPGVFAYRLIVQTEGEIRHQMTGSITLIR